MQLVIIVIVPGGNASYSDQDFPNQKLGTDQN